MKLFVRFLFCFCLFHSAAHAVEMRVLAQPFPPFSMHGEKGKADGFSLDLFKMAHAQMDKGFKADSYSEVQVTFGRMFMELQRGQYRISVALGKNSKRLDKFKWAGPYLTINMGVIARRESHINIKEVTDFNNYRIASIANAAAEQALIRQGVDLERFERTPKPEHALMKLVNKRVDMMTHAIQSTSYMIEEMGYRHADFEKVYNIKELDLYFAFSKDFTDQEIADFNQALKKVMESPNYRALIEKYHLDALYQVQ